MSKSKGGFLTVSLLEEKGYNPLVYRMFCLQSHYRKPLTFSFESLDNTAKAYGKLINRISALSESGEVSVERCKPYIDSFNEAMNNDLNTAQAITVLYDVLKAELNDAEKRYIIGELDRVLSLSLLGGADESGAPVDGEDAEIEALIEKRTKARMEKDWATADAIRDELNARNIIVEDTPQGIKWRRG